MGSVREFYEKEARKLPERREQLAALRHFYHSLHAAERSEAIELLASFPEADAARELRQLYEECGWRETRLRIVRALGPFRDGRTFEFLFRLARTVEDIPLAEAAILALGQSHHPMAARFLANLYRDGNEAFRPVVAGALGEIPDPTMAARLLADLEAGIAADKPALVKHLVLALGELKVAAAAPFLIPVAARRQMPELSLCAVVSLGKILRDGSALEPLESLYTRDPFEYHVFSGALTSVRFRSQWTLEDYLQKFFESPSPHRNLPLELNGFAAADVVEGLSLFSEPKHVGRRLQVLAKLAFPEALSWYDRFFDPLLLTPEQLSDWLVSLAAHTGDAIGPMLEKARPRVLGSPALLERWLEAVVLCLPSAPETLARLVDDGSYAAFAPAARITFVNHVAHFGLVGQTSEGATERAGRLLTRLFQTENDDRVRGRLLRAFGQIGHREEKVAVFVKDETPKGTLTPSCLFFLERLPHRKTNGVLATLLDDKTQRRRHAGALLRALSAQSALPEAASVDEFLGESLAADAPVDLRVEALRCLAVHPRPPLFAAVSAALSGEERLALSAVVATKAFRREDSADALQPLLRSSSPSLAGRALDALTALPGLRAKVIAIDFLKEHAEDFDIVDKVVRCLEAPPTEHDYFARILTDILKRYPDHPHRDGLIDLADRVHASRVTAARGGESAKIPDGGLIDASIVKLLPRFGRLDDVVKSALRSAEMPFVHRDIFEGAVDKASSILEFCKALDLYLERHFGKPKLFAALERGLHEFQNVIHAASLHEEYPSPQRVLLALGLDKAFTPETLPLHKLRTVARGILDGRILQERFRVIDGLRAWGVMLLLFTRRGGQPGRPALLPLKGATDPQIVGIAKRMMLLQDIRNPAAHRQTFVEFVGVTEVRGEVFRLLTDLDPLFE